jgi:hypothetical protein
MIKSLNKTLAKSREPLHRPLRGQDCLRTRRDDLPGRARLVGAAALHPMVAVGQGGKFGLGRYGAIGGRKRPLFDACRQIYPENFGQGLQSDLRQEMPWGQDPRILVVPLLKLPHSGEIGILPLLHDQLPGITSESQVHYKVSS